DLLLSGVRPLRRLAAADVHAGPLAVRAKPGGDSRAQSAHESPRVQPLLAKIHRVHPRGRLRRAHRGVEGPYRRHREPGERGVDHLGRRAVDGGSRGRGHAGRRSHRRVYRVRLARIPQHAGALVAVRAGRRLRTDDPVSTNGADGHPGANSSRASGFWKSRRREKNGTCDLLTCAGMSRQQGSRTMTITLLRRVGPPLLGGVVALGLTLPSNAAEELRIGYVAPTTGIFAQVGKDMVDGFQLYLDDVNSDFGGA